MNYKLSKEADSDLIDLYIYGFKQFGEVQVERYYCELESSIKLLGETPFICRERHEFTPVVRIHPYGSHIIIYLVKTDYILIVRILHGSMDIQRYLNNSQ
ncbi:MAG: type II toxin-antitoxin system RelE/ParE family toxin [Methylococcales bacterium]|jgi:toxin ParE1/3/4|nr:type II toxin-antitoxin system RelE/ParE family toxin [Methylococcales bacterium]MBT7410254.1 type II toxin-antitoxin system RelE/ParE family toxin [Methylococcales bacterium]